MGNESGICDAGPGFTFTLISMYNNSQHNQCFKISLLAKDTLNA